MNDKRLDYISDEELTWLIQDVEEREMLQAPSYLKRETLQKIRRVYYPIVPIQKKSKLELRIYSLKVGVAAAAAITLLFVLPVDDIHRTVGRNDTYRREGTWMMRQIKETSDQICQTLGEISGWLVSGEY